MNRIRLFALMLISGIVVSCDPVTATNCLTANHENYEIPEYSQDEDIYHYSGFTSSYNHKTLVPNWVAYELTEDELNGEYDTKSSSFSRDPNVKGRQASREDYSRSGWDKGHMAPKADLRWSEEAYWESHYFTNVCPQNHEMNAGDWNRLEKAVRRWAKEYGKVWIVCGPIFDKNAYGTIGNAKVNVPDKFFKAILVHANGQWATIAYVMPNSNVHNSLKQYACTVDSLEKVLGRDLFPALDDSIENKIEATLDMSWWK